MSSTKNFVGIGITEKPSSRVLRQPGGGSSIIFGDEQAQTTRTVKNHMQSNIFSTEKNGDQPRCMQKNADSHTRLFGESNSQPPTAAKNHMKSSILPVSTPGDNGHRVHLRDRNGSMSSASSSVSSSSENLKINGGISKTVGNSITGKDVSINGTNHVINKNRVPPGGFSSGLW